MKTTQIIGTLLTTVGIAFAASLLISINKEIELSEKTDIAEGVLINTDKKRGSPSSPTFVVFTTHTGKKIMTEIELPSSTPTFNNKINIRYLKANPNKVKPFDTNHSNLKRYAILGLSSIIFVFLGILLILIYNLQLIKGQPSAKQLVSNITIANSNPETTSKPQVHTLDPTLN